MEIEFNITKLGQDLRQKRIIEENLTKKAAAAVIGITDEKYALVERGYFYVKLPVTDFVKIINWLNTDPSNYFINN